MPPYKNAVQYDPGRFRDKIVFQQQVTTPDGAGGTVVTTETALITRGIKEEIGDRNQLAITAGASSLKGDCYFIIRNRKDFYPRKDMMLLHEGYHYTIAGISPKGVPVTHLKILCLFKDRTDTQV